MTTHAVPKDTRNEAVLVSLRAYDQNEGAFTLVQRSQARVNIFDSGFVLGDGVWEGIRVKKGVLMFVEEHMDRLFQGAKSLDMDLMISPQDLVNEAYRAVDANSMTDDVHIRLMVTRGLKYAPFQVIESDEINVVREKLEHGRNLELTRRRITRGVGGGIKQNPSLTIGPPTIAICPQYNEANKAESSGVSLFTVHVRRGYSDVQDPMLNSHSKINCIAAAIQASKAGADEALMLDPHGFVATCNSTNFFIVKKGQVWAPTTKFQLHGITRGTIIKICKANGIPVEERDFPLTEVYSADEAFVTGTCGGLTYVYKVDGRNIGTHSGPGEMTQRLQNLYQELSESYASKGRQHFQQRNEETKI